MNRGPGRKRNITGESKDIKRRGEGLGTGPVGRGEGYAGRKSGGASPLSGGASQGGASGTSPVRSGARRSSPIMIIIALAVVVGGFFLLRRCGGSSVQNHGAENLFSSYPTATEQSSDWIEKANTGVLDTSVADGARDKFTVLKGDGSDRATVMVYLCGTDLESKHGMATSDLKEMYGADIADNVNVIVLTGGCKSWTNSTVSSDVNQIYKVEKGGIRCLVSDDGKEPMTKSSTLSDFIKYCSKNYPAERNILVMWDHGGGAISGFGYDEKNESAGSMTLKGIRDALSAGGVKFDFVGFDACLMGTLENALMLGDYADYLIASEETEPGVGWYHTGWLNDLSAKTAFSTLQLGKRIADDFTAYCEQKCPGQKTTLSVVDLAELRATVPDKFSAFAKETVELIGGDDYKVVSDARANARSFALSSKSDQVDVVHLAHNIGTEDAKALISAVRGAVKYNRTSTNMTNAYGLAVYFPYQRTSRVDSAVKVYESIGIDSDYTQCVRSFASLEVAGQAVAGGSSSPIGSLFGQFVGQSPVSSSGVTDILGQLLGGSGTLSELTGGASSFFGRGLDEKSAAEYIAANQLDQSKLTWQKDGSSYVLALDESDWALVHDLKLNVFYDDGSGYVDLGLDMIYDFTEDGALIGEYDGAWFAINGQAVPFYFEETSGNNDSYAMSGRVPILLNGDRAELLIVFDSDNEEGYVAGVRRVYDDGETETVAKSLEALKEGDVIDFVCDYYTYKGEYEDSYKIGDQIVYDGTLTVSDVRIDRSKCSAMYMITDIYEKEYFTPVIPD